MSFVLNPVLELPGKIHVEMNTSMELQWAEKLEHIPTDIVNSFAIRVQNPDSMSARSFFQTMAVQCARIGVKELNIDVISPYSNDWIPGLTAHRIPGLESLSLKNIKIEGTEIKDQLASWLQGMPLEKLCLDNAAMDAGCWQILETLTALKHLELRSCDLHILDAVKLDIYSGLEHLGIEGSVVNFNNREEAEAWVDFCTAHPALKGVEIHIKARRENFVLFLNNFKSMKLEWIDLTFELDRAHFVFMDISKAFHEMPKLMNVRLAQKGGADFNAIFRQAVPNAKFPDLQVQSMDAEKLCQWLQNVTELMLDNLALHDETQALILDKIGKNKTLQKLNLIDVVAGSEIENIKTLGNITEFSYVDTIYWQRFPQLMSSIQQMSKLTKLRIDKRCDTWKFDILDFETLQRLPLKHLTLDFMACYSEQKKLTSAFFSKMVNLRSLEVLNLKNFYTEYGAAGIHGANSSVEITEMLSENFSTVLAAQGIHGANSSGEITEMTEMRSLSLYNNCLACLSDFQVLIEHFITLMPNLQTLRVSKIYDMKCVRHCLNVCKQLKNLEHLHLSLGTVYKDCAMDLDSILFVGDYPQLKWISFHAKSNISRFLISEIRNFFFRRIPHVTVTGKI